MLLLRLLPCCCFVDETSSAVLPPADNAGVDASDAVAAEVSSFY